MHIGRGMRAILLLAVAACSAEASIQVVPVTERQDVIPVSLPTSVTCGTTQPELANLYVGGGVTLQTACQGEGKTTIVLLHGAKEQWTAWRPLMAELSSRYRVIAPNLRGADVSIEDQIQDVVMLIRKTNTGPVIVAGGELAKRLAETHPELVTELRITESESPKSQRTQVSVR